MSIPAINNDLGKNEFLVLLSTQLQYQDPMNPVDNTEFIAQLAQFSALESAQNTNTELENMSATNLIGKTVYGVKSEDFSEFGGVVENIDLTGDEPRMFVNGKYYDLADVRNVFGE